MRVRHVAGLVGAVRDTNFDHTATSNLAGSYPRLT